MPRKMSFFMCVEQFRAREKDVTRRMGWESLQPGDVLDGCRQCMGLPLGAKVEVINRIEVVDARVEPLMQMLVDESYGRRECAREGFPDMSPNDFVEMFCEAHKGCEPATDVTRIEFRYLD